MEAGFAADELGVALHQPTRTVQVRLSASRRVSNLMPLTWLAFTSGRIDAYRVSLIASAVAKLTDNHNLIHLDFIIGDYAAQHTTIQLKGKLNRFIARWEPTSAKAAKAEKARRGVWLDHQANGMSYLRAYIGASDAIRIDAMLGAHARAHSDDRTLDQRRAHELVARLLGHADGETRPSRAVIGIVVPMTSLAGLDDRPGTLFHRVMTDPLGNILDITELGRHPRRHLPIPHVQQTRDAVRQRPPHPSPAWTHIR